MQHIYGGENHGNILPTFLHGFMRTSNEPDRLDEILLLEKETISISELCFLRYKINYRKFYQLILQLLKDLSSTFSTMLKNVRRRFKAVFIKKRIFTSVKFIPHQRKIKKIK